jgi:hypothetical protein
LDKAAHLGECLAAPVGELVDLRVDKGRSGFCVNGLFQGAPPNRAPIFAPRGASCNLANDKAGSLMAKAFWEKSRFRQCDRPSISILPETPRLPPFSTILRNFS